MGLPFGLRKSALANSANVSAVKAANPDERVLDRKPSQAHRLSVSPQSFAFIQAKRPGYDRDLLMTDAQEREDRRK